MTFDEYQNFTLSTAIYPNRGQGNITYPTLGLCGEAGEVAEKIKKIIRDSGGYSYEADKISLRKELGDVLWYVSQLASELGLSLEEVVQTNVEKLSSRKERGVLGGSGDNR